MMKRHFISVVTVGVLTLFIAGGMGAPGPWAADSKAISPAAPPAGGSGGTVAKAVPAAPAGGSGVPLAKPLPDAALPPAPAYEYNTAGKPDPFKPFMETDLALKKKMEADLIKKAAAAKERPISPLQQADIEQLRLVGIAGDDHRRTAIVEDGTAKKHYPLSVGTYIGTNGGRIVSILPDRMIIEERLPGQPEKVKKAKVKRITVMLHKEDEGKP